MDSPDMDSPDMDKRALRDAILARLREDHEAAVRRARDAAEAATHEENRAESDKDMRATEASYVARGQAGRAGEIEDAMARIAAMELHDFAGGAPIAISAVVEVDAGGKRSRYFLVPAAGGITVSVEGGPVRTVTPESPLGRALLGLRTGDDAEIRTPEGLRAAEVLSVR